MSYHIKWIKVRSIAPLILNLGMRWTWMVNFTLRLLYLWERTPVSIKQRAMWAQNQSGCFGDETNLLPLSGFEPQTVQTTE